MSTDTGTGQRAYRGGVGRGALKRGINWNYVSNSQPLPRSPHWLPIMKALILSTQANKQTTKMKKWGLSLKKLNEWHGRSIQDVQHLTDRDLTQAKQRKSRRGNCQRNGRGKFQKLKSKVSILKAPAMFLTHSTQNDADLDTSLWNSKLKEIPRNFKEETNKNRTSTRKQETAWHQTCHQQHWMLVVHGETFSRFWGKRNFNLKFYT